MSRISLAGPLLGSLRVLLLAVPVYIGAQEPTRCAPAARAIEAGRLEQRDLEVLSTCQTSGPPAIAKAWASAATTSPEVLAVLVRHSPSTPQVFQAVLATSARTTASRDVRMSAMQVMMRIHDLRLAATPAWLASARVGDPIPRDAHGGRPEANGPASSGPEIAALLARLSRIEPDSVVRHAALVLRQALEFSDPGHSPLRPGAFTLTAGCRGLVTLKSAENITLRLRVEFAGGSQSDEMWLKPTARGQPMYPPPGPVVVRYGGAEVARLTERPAVPCPGK